MPRLVRHTETSPVRFDPNLAPGETPTAPNIRPWPRDEHGKFLVLKVCRCGISKTFPLCDGSHKACKDEDQARDYVYDPATGARTGARTATNTPAREDPSSTNP